MHRTAGFVVLIAAWLAGIAGACAAGTRDIVPATREWQANGKTFAFTRSSRIVVRPSKSASLASEAQLLQHDLAALAQVSPRIVTGQAAQAGDILLEIVDELAAASAEAYSLTIDERVTIRARAAAGIFYGTQSVLQLIKLAEDRSKLAGGSTLDAPDHAIRAVMLDAGRRFYQVAHLESLMRDMAWKKQNTLHLHLSDWPAFRLRSAKYPGLAPHDAYDRADMERLQRTASRYHITIIPEIDLPAHAVALTAYRPELAFKCPSMRHSSWLVKAGVDPNDKAWTVDITRESNRVWLRELLEEFIPWFDGPYFHIGGDEYQYDNDKLQCPELMTATREAGLRYPGDVFVAWINETNRQVRAHGKQTIIWNWWTFGDNRTSIAPDKNIIINVWNASEQQRILDDGYRTILAPEELLYVSPGIEGTGANPYGIVDVEKVYQRWTPERHAGVLGYTLAVWADSAERHTDQWFFGKAYEPSSVLAEKLWSGAPASSVWEMLARLDRVGLPPAAPDHASR